MTRPLPRTNFHSSQLIRCLADLGAVHAVEPDSGFAEKLSQWIHFTDAIKLSAVHESGLANLLTRQSAAQTTARSAARSEFDRVQASLTNAIRKNCSTALGKLHMPLPSSLTAPPARTQDIAAAYAPYRQFYDAQQRDMELSIQPLRFNVRDALAKTSSRLRQLAELDAALETILRERERKLLAKVPLLLKQRFEALLGTQPDTWLARFHADLQRLLLAELDLRLQPTLGLIEALNNQ